MKKSEKGVSPVEEPENDQNEQTAPVDAPKPVLLEVPQELRTKFADLLKQLNATRQMMEQQQAQFKSIETMLVECANAFILGRGYSGKKFQLNENFDLVETV